MKPLAPSRPITHFSFLLPWASAPLCQVTRRQESSRRTTKRLRTKPDPSFTATVSPSQMRDHIVFNPPSSAPSPYHTPAAFLPVNDPRRRLLSQSHQTANLYSDPNTRLPPPVRCNTQEKKYHLKPEDIAEIRRLRTLDPDKYTRKRLAEQFGCSDFFVGMVAEVSKERKEQQAKVLENIKTRWGKRRTYAREDRQRRRELWGKDQ